MEKSNRDIYAPNPKLTAETIQALGLESMVVTVQRWEAVQYADKNGGKPQNRLKLFFGEFPDKFIVLNQTNGGYAFDNWGDDMNDWIGEKVKIACYLTNNPNGGPKIWSLAFMSPPKAHVAKGAKTPPKPAPVQEPEEDDGTDPFE